MTVTQGGKVEPYDESSISERRLHRIGEKAGGPFLIEQGRMVATNVEGVLIEGRGHWLMEEAPAQVIPKLVEFLNR